MITEEVKISNKGQSAAKKRTLTNQLAYFIGSYLGDGSVSFVPKYGNYFFSINAIDKEFVERVAKAAKDFFDKEGNVFLDKKGGGWQKRNTKPLYKTVIYGKESCKELVELTHDKRVIPEIILMADKSIQKWFIAGIMDSEGYVGKNYHKKLDRTQYLMGISSTDIWLEDFIEMLTKHGVKVGKRYREKQLKPWYRPKFRYKINTLSFIKSGCFFTIERKRQRLIDYLKSFSAQRLNAEGLNNHGIVQPIW